MQYHIYAVHTGAAATVGQYGGKVSVQTTVNLGPLKFPKVSRRVPVFHINDDKLN